MDKKNIKKEEKVVPSTRNKVVNRVVEETPFVHLMTTDLNGGYNEAELRAAARKKEERVVSTINVSTPYNGQMIRLVSLGVANKILALNNAKWRLQDEGFIWNGTELVPNIIEEE